MSPAPLVTSLRTEGMPLLSSPSFLSSGVCRRGPVGTLLYWGCSVDRMSWDRRDVTGSSHYPPLSLSVFLSRNRCSIWLSDIVIYLLFWPVPPILFLSIFLLSFDRWFVSWDWSFSIVHSLVLCPCSHFLIALSQWMRFCLGSHIDSRNSFHLTRNLFLFFFRISFTFHSSTSSTTSGLTSCLVRTSS